MSRDVETILVIIGLFGVSFVIAALIEHWRPSRPSDPTVIHPHETSPTDFLSRRSMFEASLSRLVEGVARLVGGLVGCVFVVAFLLVALYVLIWIIKRMWEAA